MLCPGGFSGGETSLLVPSPLVFAVLHNEMRLKVQSGLESEKGELFSALEQVACSLFPADVPGACAVGHRFVSLCPTSPECLG